MVYITGDTHGDFSRFDTRNFPEQKEMTKDMITLAHKYNLNVRIKYYNN